ncbi:MAG: hypothetical protein LBT46_08020 [Planctomycetaceae bacterium]|jgi:hypothetical protein|nr:hypothetical protein [Planctomycetaceae bacterium]
MDNKSRLTLLFNVVQYPLMSFSCRTIGLSVFSAVLLTAVLPAVSLCRADFDSQLDQRLQQYRQSLQQRAAKLSPELQKTIKMQTERTIKTGLAKFRSGQLNMRVALPNWKTAQEHTCFLARHCPFGGSPFELTARTHCFASAVLTGSTVPKTAESLLFVPYKPASVSSSFRSFEQPVAFSVRIAEITVLRI